MHKGFRHSPETIAKMKEAAKHRKPQSIESRKRQAESLRKLLQNPENHPMYGKKHTPESKEKMRLAHIGKWVGKNSPNFGLKRSPELRKRLSMIPHPRGKDHPRWGHTHTPEARAIISQANLRENNHGWKGGTVHSGGYVYIMSPGHPSCIHKLYVAEHRLTIESCLKRFLKRSEEGHHINKIKTDNRPENLMGFTTRSAHRRFESSRPVRPDEIIFDGRLLKH